jgi:hypothetical protein
MSVAEEVRPGVVLSDAEIRAITGRARAGDQLVELHRQGFYRARRSKVKGEVILERAHFEAVCAGHTQPKPGPKLRTAA